MISWSSLLVLTLLAGEALAAAHPGAHRRAAHHAKAPAKRSKRGSCTPKHSSLSVTGTVTSAKASTTSSSTSTTTTTTKAKTTTSTTAAAPKNTGSSNSGSSSGSSGSSSSGSSSSGSSGSSSSSSGSKITSVQAAAGSTPNNNKAGTSSGDAISSLSGLIGWYYDWTPNPASHGNIMAVPMLWGGGTADSTDASRLAAFSDITQAPQYMIGFEEPDCPSGGGSAGMSVSEGVSVWQSKIAPFQAKGTKLVSPSMCKQADETWLAQFKGEISTMWDITNVHINKNSMAGVQEDLDHYASYGKPMWITEFACVDDSNGFTPCTDQNEINTFISQIVDLFEGRQPRRCVCLQQRRRPRKRLAHDRQQRQPDVRAPPSPSSP
ncbi:Glyco-hydro-cc domain-containing protein [Mycena sanguinolenta]|uniref:Glyco-hydro-cc domain-containing protein n=1 Tax=Mycena sanguinolenta TaxID=230812 RepID=A0A8H7DHS6_9AGAR|nr:Glyco-hydro-cc domain-containing protein [Mycena sanguinolenta]